MPNALFVIRSSTVINFRLPSLTPTTSSPASISRWRKCSVRRSPLIDDRRAACNVNITPPGGGYRWHYDRNRVTALLYLNHIGGGETDLYPNYRLPAPISGQLQKGLDRILLTRPARRFFGRVHTIAPAPGTLAVIRGDRTLHSVRAVTGDHDRINLVVAYDRPGSTHQRPALDQYLYDPGPTSTHQ